MSGVFIQVNASRSQIFKCLNGVYLMLVHSMNEENVSVLQEKVESLTQRLDHMVPDPPCLVETSGQEVK